MAVSVSLNHGVQVTPDRIEAALRSLRMALPDLRSEPVEMASDGEVVVCRTVLWQLFAVQ